MARSCDTGRPATCEYIRYEIVDFNGKALSKTVPARHKKSPVYMYSGAATTCANAEVMTFPEEVEAAGFPNNRLEPDWSTEQELPWAARPGVTVRRVYCDMLAGTAAQSPVLHTLPRAICKRLLGELRGFGGRGYELLVGGELEFTVVKRDGEGAPWKPLFTGCDVFATLQNNKGMDFCYEVERNMHQVGVDILTMNAEYGEGQMELTFAPRFGIEACDATATFRTGTKEIAQNQGLIASFMARPFGVSGVGNGGHFNFSIWEPETQAERHGDNGKTVDAEDAIARVTTGKRNALHDAADPDGLSTVARHFLAGILEHAPAMEAVCAPAPPCYTRHGHWAPDVANWGPEDRSACVRVKADSVGHPGACYMELRLPSAAANPYLVTAALVAAGLDGLERSLELPPARRTKETGAVELPTTLNGALKALEADRCMTERLGPDFVRWYTGVKRAEAQAIARQLEDSGSSDEAISAAWQRMYLECV